MRLFKINTTAYEEEDFFLLTDLSEEAITRVIKPIIKSEREAYEEYENHTLLKALLDKYPSRKIMMFLDIEQLSY